MALRMASAPWPLRLWQWKRLLPKSRWPGQYTVSPGRQTFASSAASATIILKVEPGA